MKKTSLFIVDEYPVVRWGIKELFRKYPEYTVVGEGGNSAGSIKEAVRLKPDVVIIDCAAKEGMEHETIVSVMEALHKVRVVLFSAQGRRKDVVELLQAGVDGYVLKSAPAQELVAAVQTVLDGRRYISRSLTERLFDEYVLKDKEPAEPFDTLSCRELEVLGLIAGGGRAKDLADRLSVSVSTIKKHKSNIKKKLHARGMADLVRVAVSKGVVKDLCM